MTVLHQAVANRLGLATLFGPMAATEAFAGEHPRRPVASSTFAAPC